MKWERSANRLGEDFNDFLLGHPEIRVIREQHSGKITHLLCPEEYNLIESVFSKDRTKVISLKYITDSGKYVCFPEHFRKK